MKEIETRIIKINIEEIRKKLLDLGAIKVKEESQINNIYDFSDKKLLKNKGYARIRYIKDVIGNEEHYYMTVKKLISQERYKIMEENETEILDFKEGEHIFKALGLELIESISKFRESYKYKETLVEIDINDKNFCPFPYIELESNNEEELEELVELLGYSMNDTTSKTIYEILNEEKVK
ncbi:CYTH domain-containing protein [Clostridium botulinum]|uniref:CYTH domain-containing protein n=1 Tax=Clostridium botulinum TaxID=1491 RepID=A0A846J4V6_CLOBO|nr:CYTH domain-containing protein [Clostridium botulinum]ACA55191.1 putative adenylyl cyclase CyaB [Clostridium botulinum A3 str. Loch Maree]NFH64547.1 CYTH domain-containing protein [Clostridium botulinum]NFJ08281.1 CYTH domain-containing protein [Clostridium botulinum]NFK16047.1 CYTH domain-containing protein [Clostridium botulinum]NFM94832.1 CYTH domain-containing protein [Clostridium botulinum]